MSHWFLEFYISESKKIGRIKIDTFPFLIGRQVDLPLAIESSDVSRLHAEITKVGNHLSLRDLGSTNGTFINHKPVTEIHNLQHGDVLHFAHTEYRVIREESSTGFSPDETMLGISALSNNLPEGLSELQELLDNSLVTAKFEKIVDSQELSVCAYEVLGRGQHPDLPQSPKELFRIAESAGQAIRLSELFRRKGVESAMNSGITLPLFVNTHPIELEDSERLLKSISELREDFPSSKLVLEIHEEAIADQHSMNDIRSQLKQFNVGVAYDDFGAGQARLLELVEAPPDILKFDIAFIRGIDSAPQARLHMIEVLVELCKEAGVKALAEGVDSAMAVDICRELGFDLLQGYHF